MDNHLNLCTVSSFRSKATVVVEMVDHTFCVVYNWGTGSKVDTAANGDDLLTTLGGNGVVMRHTKGHALDTINDCQRSISTVLTANTRSLCTESIHRSTPNAGMVV